MNAHPTATAILLGLAVGLAIICSFGMAIMRDAFQRLHFAGPVVWFSSLLIVIAVFLDEPQAQARLKVVLIALLLLALNAVLTHATGKATRVRKAKHWEVRPDEHIRVEDTTHRGARSRRSGGRS